MRQLPKLRRFANACHNRKLILVLVLHAVVLVFLYNHFIHSKIARSVVKFNADSLTICEEFSIPSRAVVDRCRGLESIQQKTELCDVYKSKIAAYPTYNRQVDIRFIVITFNRAQSLKQCLEYLNKVHLDGDVASIDIWIDRYANDTIDEATLAVANTFRKSRNDVTVHIQPRHAGLYGQWINTWRPVKGSKELAFFLEDDIDISPMAYRWLKRAHLKYGSRNDVVGYSLQDQAVLRADEQGAGKSPRSIHGTAFLHRVPGVWGFAPQPDKWKLFQNWFYFIRLSCTDFRPYIERAPLFIQWYKELERRNYTHSMWSIWLIYFTDAMDLFSLHANIPTYTKRTNASLVYNRKEQGLHFRKAVNDDNKQMEDTSSILLFDWDDNFTRFPHRLVKFDYDGQIIFSIKNEGSVKIIV